MIATLKSEFRKLLSVRSTYVIGIIALLLIALMAFYIEGYRGSGGSAASLASDGAIAELTLNAAVFAGIFAGIVAVLFMVHEYRYNTIMYTLTASNSRTKVLLSKIIVLLVYGTAFTVLCAVFAIACYGLGLSLRDVTLPAQHIDVWYVMGRALFYNLSFVLFGLLFATLTRNIAASIVTLFIAPSTIEPLLSLLLKDKAVYLPFAARERVISSAGGEGAIQGHLSVSRALMVVSAYLIVSWIITWYLFLRRDAN